MSYSKQVKNKSVRAQKNAVAEHIKIDPVQDLIWITVAEYEFFLDNGRTGIDALAIRNHIVFMARIRRDAMMSLPSYHEIETETGLSERRSIAAVAFLRKHGFFRQRTAEA